MYNVKNAIFMPKTNRFYATVLFEFSLMIAPHSFHLLYHTSANLSSLAASGHREKNPKHLASGSKGQF